MFNASFKASFSNFKDGYSFLKLGGGAHNAVEGHVWPVGLEVVVVT